MNEYLEMDDSSGTAWDRISPLWDDPLWNGLDQWLPAVEEL